jgi:RND family efflux transporter MFP subunit
MKGFTATCVCLVFAAGLITTAGCGEKGKTGTGREATPVVTGVALQSVIAGAFPEQIEAIGTVKARNSSLIAARIAATVTGIHVKEGDRVPKGKLLVTLEATEVTSGAAGARAGADEALRGVEEARAREKLAAVTFERYRKLLQEQAVTRQEFDVRRMEKDVATEGVARAGARFTQAREGAKSAGAIAAYTRISAPFAGIVTAKPVEVGMTVFPGMPLLTVEEQGHYRLEVAAPESLFGRVTTGNPVNISIDGIGSGISGTVAEVVPAVDPASRTFIVKVDVEAKGIRSGAYGRALFPVGTRTGLSVPKSSLVTRGALTSVWVVGKDNVARMRLVKAGQALGDRVEILSGLSEGERVVVTGVEKVSDGAKVE